MTNLQFIKAEKLISWLCYQGRFEEVFEALKTVFNFISGDICERKIMRIFLLRTYNRTLGTEHTAQF